MPKKIGYTIIDVLPDEFRIKNTGSIRDIVDLPEITDINFINGWTQGKDWLKNNGVKSTVLPGEMGAVASTIEVWKYIVDNDWDEVLVFENDAVLVNDFMELFYYYRAEVPEDFDILSLCAAERDRVKFDNQKDCYDIGRENICIAYQNWPSNAILYSRRGAERALKSFKRIGRINHTIDVLIYEHLNLKAYTLIPASKRLVGRHLGQSTANPAWTGEGWPEVEW